MDDSLAEPAVTVLRAVSVEPLLHGEVIHGLVHRLYDCRRYRKCYIPNTHPDYVRYGRSLVERGNPAGDFLEKVPVFQPAESFFNPHHILILHLNSPFENGRCRACHMYVFCGRVP